MEVTDLSDLVQLYGKTVYGFCHKLTKNMSDTDDLYQETFLKAMELCARIDKNNNPKAFLISIAIRLWKNNRRKIARRQSIAPTTELDIDVDHAFLSPGEETPEDIILSNELHLAVQAAADTLNDKLKIPLYMYYTAEMSIEDIASALRIPQGTVKSRLYKARKSMKNVLEVKNYGAF